MAKKMLYLVLPLFLVACSQHVRAGVTIKQEMKNLKNGQVIGEMVQYLEAGRFRLITTEGKKKLEIIFLAAEKTIYFIDHKKKQITVLDEEGLEEMRKRLEEAMKVLESMPSEVREMMSESMINAPVQIVAGATGQTVGPYTCRIYLISQGTIPLVETCNAPLGRAMLREDELRTMRAMSALFEPLLMGGGGDPSMVIFAEEIEGYPVRTIIMDGNGNPAREHLITSAVREEFGDDVFALPAGYKRKKMETRPGVGRRKR